jgi:hypothetical protein
MAASKGIFCVEGFWTTDLRTTWTVRTVLQFLKDNAGIPYVHNRAAARAQFEHHVSRFPQAAYRKYPILYLAFHGREGSLCIWGNDDYSLENITSLLQDKCHGRIVVLGGCSVLNIDKRKLKAFLRTMGALAICGYRNDVDWIRSSAFEMLLLSELQDNVFDRRGIRPIVRKCTALAKAFKAADPEKDIRFRIVSTLDLARLRPPVDRDHRTTA